MSYFLAFVQSFAAAINMIVGQKTLEVRSIGNNWQTALSRGFHIIMLAILAWFGIFAPSVEPFSANLMLYVGLFLLGIGVLYVTYPLRRTAYLNEKISVLQPFALMRQIFSILFAIVLLSEKVSNITLWVTTFSIIILIVTNIENRKIVLNRYSGMVLLSSLLQAGMLAIVVKMIQLFWPLNYYFIESFGILAIASALIVYKGESREIMSAKRSYFKLQCTTNFLALVSILSSFALYEKLGVTMTSLFSLLSLIFTMILGATFLSDIPKRKNVYATILIGLCIAVGTVFRQGT